jgi:hypothetical protein
MQRMTSDQPISAAYTDPLSPLARRVLALDSSAAYARLVVREDGHAEAARLLAGMSAEDTVSGLIASKPDAAALLAGLWLWHDWLDESHKLSQANSTPTGSFLHANMHSA